jgi:ADP-heptose:LPS heptosyltransferase
LRWDSISLMNECDLYIGIDTELYHMTAALGKAQFVFFRNNESKINCYNNTYYLDSDLICSNQCMQPYTSECYSERRCMDEFDMDKCLELIKKIL